MAIQQAYVYCPHIIEKEEQEPYACRRRIPIPFAYLDGKPFIIECPSCGNEITVDTPLAQDGPDDEEVQAS